MQQVSFFLYIISEIFSFFLIYIKEHHTPCQMLVSCNKATKPLEHSIIFELLVWSLFFTGQLAVSRSSWKLVASTFFTIHFLNRKKAGSIKRIPTQLYVQGLRFRPGIPTYFSRPIDSNEPEFFSVLARDTSRCLFRSLCSSSEEILRH